MATQKLYNTLVNRGLYTKSFDAFKQQFNDTAFAQFFKTHAGQVVLDYFKKKTIDQPAWIPGADPSNGYSREGQNSVIREILSRIERTYGRSSDTTNSRE